MFLRFLIFGCIKRLELGRIHTKYSISALISVVDPAVFSYTLGYVLPQELRNWTSESFSALIAHPLRYHFRSPGKGSLPPRSGYTPRSRSSEELPDRFGNIDSSCRIVSVIDHLQVHTTPRATTLKWWALSHQR
jgi:hypothetical protein